VNILSLLQDVCVEATTGSGKTLAFGIPVFEMLQRREQPFKRHEVGALIIAPTRELAAQIFEVFQELSAAHEKFRCILLVGGCSVRDNIDDFESKGANIVIGTPGRILDVHNRSDALDFRSLEVLVLDEADTLLAMGFRDTITQILGLLPKQRRTGLFSATQTKEVKELARVGMRNPVSVAVHVQQRSSNAKRTNGSENDSKVSARQQATPSTLENYFTISPYDERPAHLALFLAEHAADKIIVFCATCACVDYYSKVFEALASTTGKTRATLSDGKSKSKKAVQNGGHRGDNSRKEEAESDEDSDGDASSSEDSEEQDMEIEEEKDDDVGDDEDEEEDEDEDKEDGDGDGDDDDDDDEEEEEEEEDDEDEDEEGSSPPGQLTQDSSSSTAVAAFPQGMSVVGFHGKMVPKKRAGLYKKFVSLESGVLFCTDVAARGVDIPDVDWIVQLASPKDPAFFVHRVGRTARAGKR
jgi:superfamily II DNA/RNA helicase